MRNIDEAIKEKRAAITRLQADLEVLERARSLLNGGSLESPSVLEQVLRGGRRIKKQHPLKGRFNPKSSVGHSVIVLREAAMPLHIDDILARVKKRGHDAQKTSLGSSLAKLAKQGKIFYRAPQPNTFGLLEWEKAKAVAQS